MVWRDRSVGCVATLTTVRWFLVAVACAVLVRRSTVAWGMDGCRLSVAGRMGRCWFPMAGRMGGCWFPMAGSVNRSGLYEVELMLFSNSMMTTKKEYSLHKPVQGPL